MTEPEKHLDACDSLEEALDVAFSLAVLYDGEKAVLDELKAELKEWTEKEISKYRDAAIAASNMLSPQFRDAIRKAVGLPAKEDPLS